MPQCPTDLLEITFATPTKVDQENGVIHGAKILGSVSANGYTYAPKALQEAVNLYEGIDVNLDHPPRTNADQDRPMMEGVGVISKPYFKDGGIYGDIHLIMSHPSSKLLLERAERFPENFGLSHNAIAGKQTTHKGKLTIESIARVRSVDFVRRPATTKTLFESKEDTVPNPTVKDVLKALPNTHPLNPLATVLQEQLTDQTILETAVTTEDDVDSDEAISIAFETVLVATYRDTKLDTKGKLSRIKDALTAQDKITSPAPSSSTDSSTSSTQSSDATESVDELKTRLDRLENEKLLQEEITKANVKTTPELFESLLQVPKSSWPSLIGNLAKKPSSNPKSFATGTVLESTTDVKPASDAKTFSSRILNRRNR
jgi:hypothetical protein